MIKRLVEQTLLERLKQFPAVAIVGARQVGKTTLARKIAKSDLSVYLDLENPRDIAKLQGDGFTYMESVAGQLVTVDEVQRMPELFTWLRPLIDAKRKPGRFLCSVLPHRLS